MTLGPTGGIALLSAGNSEQRRTQAAARKSTPLKYNLSSNRCNLWFNSPPRGSALLPISAESVAAYGGQCGVEIGLSKVEPQIADDPFRWFWS